MKLVAAAVGYSVFVISARGAKGSDSIEKN
jgi:hypothetical protein